MKIMIDFHSFFLFYVLVLTSHAQIQQIGKFNSVARQIYFGKRADSGLNGSKFKVQVPFHDSKKLLQADEAQKSTNLIHSVPFTYAKAIEMEIDSRVDGIWEENFSAGLKIWSIFIESKTALGIALIFDQFFIINEGELYVMNEKGILGAYTKANNKSDGKFAVRPLEGSSVFLIYVEPLKGTKPLNYFKISKVVHAYRDIFQSKVVSGSCNIDSRCISNFVSSAYFRINSLILFASLFIFFCIKANQKRATIVFMTDQLQKFCTGVMINNVKGDGRQLLLTANHCVFTDLSNSIAGFNYERSGCSSGDSISEPQTAHGMKLLTRGSTSDFALFEVVEKIPSSYNVYLSGWDANVPNLNLSDTFAGIHHPSGDVKKISLYAGKVQLSSWSEGPGKSLHIMIPKWTRGVTEPGSSGSPLFNSNGNLIGQLHGGASSCGNPTGSDLYGGFAFSFRENGSGASLKPFLDPNGIVQNLILSGRNLYGGSINTGTTTMTTTVTATATTRTTTIIRNTCECVPKAIVDKLIQSYESRIKLLESNKN